MRRSLKMSGSLFILGLLVAAPPASAAGPDACRNNAVQFDVCIQAQKLKAEFADEPAGKRLGRGIYQSVDVDGPTLTYLITWPLPPNEIAKQVDPTGEIREPLRGQLTKLANDTVCRDPRSAAMTRLGAAYTYRFALADGRRLSEVHVSACPLP